MLDRKTGVKANSTDTLYSYWKADVATATDYYPFGMEMMGRTYSASIGLLGKFGFNGQQKDDEIAGIGNSLDFGARMYNPRLARLGMSVDPLFMKFPSLSTYQFAQNNPVSMVDIEGKRGMYFTKIIDLRTGITTLSLHTTNELMPRVEAKGAVFDTKSWHDFGAFTTLVIDRDGSRHANPTSYVLSPTSKSTTSWNLIPQTDEPTRTKDAGKFDGWIMISPDADGSDNFLNPKAGKNVNVFKVDGILAAFGMSSGELPTSASAKFENIADVVEHINNSLDAGGKFGDAWNAGKDELSNRKTMDGSVHCNTCNANYERENGTMTYDRSDQPAIDTQESH